MVLSFFVNILHITTHMFDNIFEGWVGWPDVSVSRAFK